MAPIVIWLVRDLIRNPSKWLQGFKKKLGNIHEYYPDPSYADPSRRKSGREIETEILKEIGEDDDRI